MGVVVAIAVVALGAAAWLVLRGAPAPHRPAPAPSRTITLSAPAAYDSVRILTASGKAYESLPYFDVVLAAEDPARPNFEVHANHAAALFNSIVQLERRRDIPVASVRSGLERARLLDRSMREYEIASGASPRAVDRAYVLGQLGASMQVYGLPWEACVAYMEAHNAEPADPKVLVRSQAFQRRMLDPSAPAPEKP